MTENENARALNCSEKMKSIMMQNKPVNYMEMDDDGVEEVTPAQEAPATPTAPEEPQDAPSTPAAPEEPSLPTASEEPQGAEVAADEAPMPVRKTAKQSTKPKKKSAKANAVPDFRTSIVIPFAEHRRIKAACAYNNISLREFTHNALLSSTDYSYTCKCGCTFAIQVNFELENPSIPVPTQCPVCGNKKLQKVKLL